MKKSQAKRNGLWKGLRLVDEKLCEILNSGLATFRITDTCIKLKLEIVQ